MHTRSALKRAHQAAPAPTLTISPRLAQFFSAASDKRTAAAASTATAEPAAPCPNELLPPGTAEKWAEPTCKGEEENEEETQVKEQRPSKKQKISAAAPQSAAAASPSAPAAPTLASDAAAAAAAGVAARSHPSVLSFPDSVLHGPLRGYSAAFDRIARDLMLRHELVANGHRLRIMEIEFYWRGQPADAGETATTTAAPASGAAPQQQPQQQSPKAESSAATSVDVAMKADAAAAATPSAAALEESPATASFPSGSASSSSPSAAPAESPLYAGHVDPFAHAHPVQLNNYGRWYWHRQGTKEEASYKGGNYKGMDVTIGAESGGGYGGILVRSIQRINDGVIVEGSCRVAEEVLRLHGADSIAALVATWKGNLCAFDNPTLYFAPALHAPSYTPGEPVLIRSPRVGLTLKQKGERRPPFLMLPYRYSALPFFNKKRKETIVLSVYRELGPSQLSAVSSLCSIPPAALSRLVSFFESGSALRSMSSFVSSARDNPTVEGMAKMFGAWSRCFGEEKHTAILRA